MTMPMLATRRERECKLAFHVQRRPHFLRVAIGGEASFDQGEVMSTQLLRIPLDAYSLVVLDLAELRYMSSLAMDTLEGFRRDLGRRGVEVRLANLQARVWLALESTGLGRLFEPMHLEQQP